MRRNIQWGDMKYWSEHLSDQEIENLPSEKDLPRVPPFTFDHFSLLTRESVQAHREADRMLRDGVIGFDADGNPMRREDL